MKEERQEIDIVPTTETTAELIPGQTAEMIEKSFAQNTIRNRRHALQKFDEWLQGKQITDGLLAEYITHLFDLGKAPGTISIAVSAVKWLLSTTMAERRWNSLLPLQPYQVSVATVAIEVEDNATDSRGKKLKGYVRFKSQNLA